MLVYLIVYLFKMSSKNEVDLCGRMSTIDFTEREEEKGNEFLYFCTT